MNSIETKYIEQDELGQNWLRLNYDSGAAVTALPIAIAGDLPLEKCGEFRVASAAVIPNLGKVKMKVRRKHKVWNRRGKNIRLYREGNLYHAYVRTGDVTQELAPVEPAEESWTRMEVDGQRDKQEESEDQPEELGRVLEARQPTELERQKHPQKNHAVFAPWCEVCVKAKGTGAQHRRQMNKELAKQEHYGPRIYSDFFYMSEE